MTEGQAFAHFLSFVGLAIAGCGLTGMVVIFLWEVFSE